MEIPNYGLYGEKEGNFFPEYVHIESLRARGVQHGWKFKPHRHHNLYQFFFILNGDGTCQIEGKMRNIVERQLLVIAPLVIHGFKLLPDTEGWVLTIPDIYLQKLFQHEPIALDHLAKNIYFQCTSGETSAQFGDIFDAITKEHQRDHALSKLALKGYITLLIAKILTEQPTIETNISAQPSRKQQLLASFKELINEHFKKRFSVSDYASLLGITPTHLTRICKSILGVSASKLIDERAILETQRLLIYTSMTITAISYELGFSDPAHFSKYFHKNTKLNPTQFRKEFTKK